MNDQNGFIRHAACLLFGAGLLSSGPGGHAAAADLGPYAPAPQYTVAEPSPCWEFEQSFSSALGSIRETARLFRSQDREFHRLKRIRENDGYVGPDISLNAVMNAEQIDVSTKATEVSISVDKARQWGCFPPARLNRIQNEAARIKQTVGERAFWTDPRTFW
ncbi:MAG: hypothetical protein JO196_12020 [Hyphomicrobiales bacterium]|nr:hypothetical protein [Hyphomicrobiales bacterium]MBV9976334.1 hypothetical protein [Hyphomicrobiales bacterium]